MLVKKKKFKIRRFFENPKKWYVGYYEDGMWINIAECSIREEARDLKFHLEYIYEMFDYLVFE